LNHDLGRTSRGECDHEQNEREQVSGFHEGIIAKPGKTAPGSGDRPLLKQSRAWCSLLWRGMRSNVTIDKCKDLSPQRSYWPRG
jgi:hypothetical protein